MLSICIDHLLIASSEPLLLAVLFIALTNKLRLISVLRIFHNVNKSYLSLGLVEASPRLITVSIFSAITVSRLYHKISISSSEKIEYNLYSTS